MSKDIVPTDIMGDVEAVLRQSAAGKGPENWFVTAYQILERLPPATRDALTAKYGASGKGAGTHYSPASAVAVAGDMLVKRGLAERVYLDTQGIKVRVAGLDVAPGFEVTSIFRIKP